MKAIILAGGEGTRLRPVTASLPKPMAPILGRPVLEYAIRLLKKHGILDIGITLGYMPEAIRAYFGDGSDFGVRLTYFMEDTPLGTAGSVKNTGDFIDGDFLVLCGDAITDMDLSAFLAFHREKEAEASLLLCRRALPLSYGVVVTDDEGHITRFLEKPSWGRVTSDMVNTGIYLLKPSVLSLADRFPSDFARDVFPRLLEEGRPLFGYAGEGFWCDIGDIDALRHAQYDILAGKTRISIPAPAIAPGIYTDEGAEIAAGAHVTPPVFLGKGTRVESGAEVEAYTVLGDGCTVSPGASVKRSILANGVFVEANAQIRGSIVCAHSVIGEGACVYEQSAIGADCRIGKGAVVRPGVRIWPGKAVGEGEVLSENLVWGHALTPDTFSARTFSGPIGKALTPFSVARFGAAFASLFPGTVAIASDGSPAAGMLSAALMAGVLSTGSETVDFGTAPAEALRIAAKGGAVHMAASGEVGTLSFWGKDGLPLSTAEAAKLHSLFLREDFTFAAARDIQPPRAGFDAEKAYLRHILKSSVPKGARVLLFGADAEARRLLSAAAKEGGFSVFFAEGDAKDEEARRAFRRRVAREKFTFGAACSEDGSFLLVDERGREVPACLCDALFARLLLRRYRGEPLYLPASAPSYLSEMAEKWGTRAVYTEDAPAVRMRALLSGGEAGRAQYLLSFDTVGGTVRLLALLGEEGVPLSSLLDSLPAFFAVQRAVPCAEGDKGRIMRALLPLSEPGEAGGLRFSLPHGTVFIVPDEERAACRLVTHAAREEYAAELADLYEEKVKAIIEEKE